MDLGCGLSQSGIDYLKEFWKQAKDRERMKFLFELFDLDGDFQVEKREMIEVFEAMFQYCNVDVAKRQQATLVETVNGLI